MAAPDKVLFAPISKYAVDQCHFGARALIG
jgi:hypothetical protein